MVVWEEAELASPHNQGTSRPLVRNSNLQGDGRNTRVNRQDVSGQRWEEKWRPGKIGAPEARETRRSRREGLSARSGRGTEGDFPVHSGPGSQLSSQADALPSKDPPAAPSPRSPHPARISLGGIGGRPGRSREAGGRGPPRHQTREQERRGGRLPCLLEPRKPSGLPGEVPFPLRPGVGVTPGRLLFLEPKPHSPQPSGSFPALWVLSIGPAQRPNLALAQAPLSTVKVFPSKLFFVPFPSSFFTIVVLMYLPVVNTSIFLFLHSF